MIIRPARSIQGEISMPGDKSISHRAAIVSSLAEGESRIENFATGDDCASTLSCLRQLGVRIEQKENEIAINGVGQKGLSRPDVPLDCGNSGTTMRLLAGVLAGQPFDSVLTGDESLLRRPMDRIIEPLCQMGAAIESENGRPPLRIRGSAKLKGINYLLPVASAQVKSCVLLAGLYADGQTVVREKVRTRDHTERMLRAFGIDQVSLETDGENAHALSGGRSIRGRGIVVPGDISSAAFFLVAAACLPGSDLLLRNVGVNETRSAILSALKNVGADLSLENTSDTSGEPITDIRINGGIASSGTIKISGARTAELIDEIPILAMLGTQIAGIEVRDARELRHKEADRIAAIVSNLRKMNATVEEFEDGFRVEKSHLKGVEVDSFGDHRIAMAFGVAGLLAEGETTILNAECVDISFPRFFDTLESVVKS